MLGSLPTAALRCVRGALRATVDKAISGHFRLSVFVPQAPSPAQVQSGFG